MWALKFTKKDLQMSDSYLGRCRDRASDRAWETQQHDPRLGLSQEASDMTFKPREVEEWMRVAEQKNG